MPAEAPKIPVEPGRILVVDDEANIRRGLLAILSKDGHHVAQASSGEEALPMLEEFAPEAAIIDIRMPGMSGVELLHEIRTRRPHTSVVLLTGHGTLETAVAAIKEGAHDYLLKPSQPDAIRSVVQTALAAARRSREQSRLFDSLRSSLFKLGELPATSRPHVQAEREGLMVIGDLRIDARAHEVRRGDRLIPLTPSEFQLLVTLANHQGRVLEYVKLVQTVLDYDAEPWEAKELIKRHVFSLRKKIEPEPSAPVYILNVRGVGYRLSAPG